MQLTDLITIIGAVGGFQGLIEGARWWRGRKTQARVDVAEVEAKENENGRRQIDWLEKRLAERDAKIDHIYQELRAEQSAHLEAIHRCHETELRLAEAEVRKCNKRGCSERQPPSDY